MISAVNNIVAVRKLILLSVLYVFLSYAFMSFDFNNQISISNFGNFISYIFAAHFTYLVVTIDKSGFNFSMLYLGSFFGLLLLQPLLSYSGIITPISPNKDISKRIIEIYNYMTVSFVYLFFYGWVLGGGYKQYSQSKSGFSINLKNSIFFVNFSVIALVISKILLVDYPGYFVYVYYILLPLLVLYPPIISKVSKLYILHLLIFLILCLYTSVEYHVRTMGVSVVVTLILSFYYRDLIVFKLDDLSKIKNNRKYFIYIFIIFVLIIFSVFYRFVRGYENYQFNVETELNNFPIYIQKTFDSGDLGAATNTMKFMQLVPASHDYLYGQSYWRILAAPIPRSIYPEKPENTQRIIASWVNPNIKNYTLAPGVTGDAYINFGVYGVFVYIFYGFFMAKLDRNSALRYFFLFSSSFVIFYHLARGAFTNGIITLLVIYFSAVIYEKRLLQ